eukprot:SAG11_NODE_11200_length_777_cov_0.827434_1_plen_89_part_00
MHSAIHGQRVHVALRMVAPMFVPSAAGTRVRMSLQEQLRVWAFGRAGYGRFSTARGGVLMREFCVQGSGKTRVGGRAIVTQFFFCATL